MHIHSQYKVKNKEGAALLVALWVLIILSLIVGSFAFEVQLESMLVSHKRKKFSSHMAARSGLEYAKAILDKRNEAKELEIEDMPEDRDGFMKNALYIKRGLPATSTIEMEDGSSFTVTLESAEGRLNVNTLNRQDWLDIFEMSNVPSTEWDIMIDCLEDWIDDNDLERLNGAESEDPFYEERGYPVKDGPLDSVEELLLIKNWGPDILYGKPADEDTDTIYGIGELLTVWGDGKLNLNTANVEAMLAAGISEEKIDEILDARLGLDGVQGTLDDGLSNDYISGDNRFKLQSNFVRVTSVGDTYGNRYRIECIYYTSNKSAVPVYWSEGPVREHGKTR